MSVEAKGVECKRAEKRKRGGGRHTAEMSELGSIAESQKVWGEGVDVGGLGEMALGLLSRTFGIHHCQSLSTSESLDW